MLEVFPVLEEAKGRDFLAFQFLGLHQVCPLSPPLGSRIQDCMWKPSSGLENK